jgi:ubiquinone/menaquinone biosynthesis C-methylase UbiE
MKNLNKTISTSDVERWWEENPFTFGVATRNYQKNDLVGRIAVEEMNLQYFKEVERKFRKHSASAGQEDGDPLLSKLVDYSFIKDKRVLDIACGTGLHAVSFAEKGAIVVGIDITDYAVSQTTRNFELRGLDGEILKMDAQKIEFQDNFFDFVNAWGCLMHMPDTEEAVREIWRVLRPGGRVLAYMYNKNSWPFWFNIFLIRGIIMAQLIRYRGDTTRLTSRYSDGSHKTGNMLTKFFTPKQVEEIFRRAGFNHIEVFPWRIEHEPDHWPMRKFPIFKYLPKSLKNWMAERWGYGLIIKAEKHASL